MGLDVFPTRREMARVQPRQWHPAARQLEAASEASRGASHVVRAWRQAEQTFDEAMQSEVLVQQVEAACCWLDASGHLLSRHKTSQQLDQASQQLVGSQWSKGRRWLQDE